MAGTAGLPRCVSVSSLKTTRRRPVLRAPPLPSLMFSKSSRMSCGDSSAGAAGAAAMTTFSTGAGAGAAATGGGTFNCAICAFFLFGDDDIGGGKADAEG